MKLNHVIFTVLLFSCSPKESRYVVFPVNSNYDECGTFTCDKSDKEYIFFAKKRFNPNLKVFDDKGQFVDSVSLQKAESILGSISKIWMTSMDSIYVFSSHSQKGIIMNRNGESVFIDNLNTKIKDDKGNEYDLYPPFLQYLDMKLNSSIIYTTFWHSNKSINIDEPRTLQKVNNHIRDGYLLYNGNGTFGMKIADIIELKDLNQSIFLPYYKAIYLDNSLFFITYYSKHLYRLADDFSIKQIIQLIPTEFLVPVPIPIPILENDMQKGKKQNQLEEQIAKRCFISNILYCIPTRQMISIIKMKEAKEDLFVYPFQIEVWDRDFKIKEKTIMFDEYNHYPASSFVCKEKLYIEKKTTLPQSRLFEIIYLNKH